MVRGAIRRLDPRKLPSDPMNGYAPSPSAAVSRNLSRGNGGDRSAVAARGAKQYDGPVLIADHLCGEDRELAFAVDSIERTNL